MWHLVTSSKYFVSCKEMFSQLIHGTHYPTRDLLRKLSQLKLRYVCVLALLNTVSLQ